MKSPKPFARRSLALAALSSLLLLAACGQKGPLFMPRIPPDPLAKTSPKPADKSLDQSADQPADKAAGASATKQ